jgi:hypothetical protein
MTFLYTDTRTHRERKIADAAIRNSWTVSDIFVPEADFVSSYQSEPERLKWAPILVALAFGENTAHDGFGSRIAAANDIATKNWLCIHLLDESKHTEGFSSLLNYLYPSLKRNHQTLFSHRDAFRFYGHTHRAECLVQWLICTQIAEVFGRQCYRALHTSLQDDPIVRRFLGNIISDEARHIFYIGSLINTQRSLMREADWDNLKPYILRMIKLGRNMFEAGKKGENYRALQSLDINASKFCDVAELELQEKYL